MIESLAITFKEVGNEGLKSGVFDLPRFTNSIEVKEVNSFKEADKPLYKKEFKSLEESLDDLSDEEKEIYKNANLEKGNIEGRDCLKRIDVDYDEKVGPFGETNLEIMKQGRSPINKNGEKIELHHIGQEMDSPLAELTPQEHRGKGNDGILHKKNIESQIDRNKFNIEKENYWKARAAEIEKARGE